MVALDKTRTRVNLEHAFTEEGRFNRRVLQRRTALSRTTLARTMLESGARIAGLHLDLLVAGEESTATAGISEMIDDRTAMYAGMTRGEGFEEIADWFETLAKSRRSHVRRSRRMAQQYDSET
jgi:hypothetical protein